MGLSCVYQCYRRSSTHLKHYSILETSNKLVALAYSKTSLPRDPPRDNHYLQLNFINDTLFY
jgi:hypothetical protein